MRKVWKLTSLMVFPSARISRMHDDEFVTFVRDEGGGTDTVLFISKVTPSNLANRSMTRQSFVVLSLLKQTETVLGSKVTYETKQTELSVNEWMKFFPTVFEKIWFEQQTDDRTS